MKEERKCMQWGAAGVFSLHSFHAESVRGPESELEPFIFDNILRGSAGHCGFFCVKYFKDLDTTEP